MTRVTFIIASSIAILTIVPAIAADNATLLRQAQQIFQPLKGQSNALAAPTTREQVSLGRLLFFDPRITVDGNVSCATCHQPALFGTDGRPTSIGVKQRPHPRNAPTVLSAGFYFVNHWRGDRESLEDQAKQAITAPISSGLDQQAVIAGLRDIGGYPPLFKAAFPNDPDPMTVDNMANAIAAYERTLATPAPFDAYLGGNVNAISPAARAGLATFINAGCGTCHNGIGIGGGMYQKFGIAEDYWVATGSRPIDRGRADVTGNSADLYVQGAKFAKCRNDRALLPRRIGRDALRGGEYHGTGATGPEAR
jgi:cytochrome c peroxidase